MGRDEIGRLVVRRIVAPGQRPILGGVRRDPDSQLLIDGFFSLLSFEDSCECLVEVS